MDHLDRAAKVLLRRVPGSLLARFLPGFRRARGGPSGVPVELVWQKRVVDHVLGVERGKTRAALHVEVAATPQPDMPARLLIYNTGLRIVGYRRVVSVVIYLKPGKRKVKDELLDDGAGVSPVAFSFAAIRLWEEDARHILRGRDTGFLPFLPYARGSSPELVQRGLRRLTQTVPLSARQADLMAVLATFANDQFPEVEWFAMIPKEIAMRSKFLTELEARGKAEGKAVPEVEVVTIGIKPSIERWNLIEQARKANAAIEAAAKQDKRQRFVGVEKAMLGKDGKPRPELYLKDGLHMTEAGYEVWTSLLEPVIDELVVGKGKKPGKGNKEQGKPKDPLQALIGKTVPEAQAWLKANPTPSPDHPGTNVTMVRPIRIDGEDQIMTMDLRADRVDVVVVGGKITEISGVR